ncbi:MAG: hypothetical protein BGN84_10850 [Afipia sp. 62-7]|nr:hypothetical protein [Afipia sp.]OJU14923.1 MAG: hypothetical protein BGN84_10850 [Afipia sp. 62-7]
MKRHVRIAAGLLAVGIGACGTTSAFARGAAPSVMSSPGYQRALEDSRKRYKDSYSQPYTKPPAVYPHKKWRKRGKR